MTKYVLSYIFNPRQPEEKIALATYKELTSDDQSATDFDDFDQIIYEPEMTEKQLEIIEKFLSFLQERCKSVAISIDFKQMVIKFLDKLKRVADTVVDPPTERHDIQTPFPEVESYLKPVVAATIQDNDRISNSQ